MYQIKAIIRNNKCYSIDSREDRVESAYNKKERIWTRRFIGAAIFQGAIVVGLTIFLVLSQISILKPEISRVIAAGGGWVHGLHLVT